MAIINPDGLIYFEEHGSYNKDVNKPWEKENATQAAISGHMSATLLQRRGVHNNEAAKRNFN